MAERAGLKIRARLVAAVAVLGLVAVACNTAVPIAGVIGIPGTSGDSFDALSSKLNRPEGVALDLTFETECFLYVADTVNNRIRALPTFGVPGFLCPDRPVGATLKGKVAAISKNMAAARTALKAKAAGSPVPLLSSGTEVFTVGPTGRANTLNGPTGLAVDNEGAGPGDESAGNLYIADTGNSRIMVLTPPDDITGKRTLFRVDNGGLKLPRGIAILPSESCFGNLYPMLLIADTGHDRIAMMNLYSGQVSTLMSGGLNKPEGVAFDFVRCAVIVADTANNQLIALHKNGTREFIDYFNRPTAVTVDLGIAFQCYESLIGVSETGAHRIDYILPPTPSCLAPTPAGAVRRRPPTFPTLDIITVVDGVQGKVTQTQNTLFDPRGLQLLFVDNWSADANQHVVSFWDS
jgi:DNA-binding beta-propeller fold protein YncE